MLHGARAENSSIGNQHIVCQSFEKFRFPNFVAVHDIIYDNGLIQVIQILNDRSLIRELNDLREPAIGKVIRDGIGFAQFL